MAKINLRKDNLPEDKELFVLDCYCGNGTIWNRIKKETGKNIKTLSIDILKKSCADIVCDNLKVISGINLDKFNVIDLDAYGIPFAQLQMIIKKKYSGVVFMTVIQTHHGNLPNAILIQSGFTKEMLNKARSLFTKNPIELLEMYLETKNIFNYRIKSLDRKHYLSFTVPKC